MIEPEEVHPGGSGEAGRERLFVGVPCPEDLLAQVQRVQEGLAGVSGLRLLLPEQLHVTLAFIGSAAVEAREEARRVVREAGGLPSGRAYLRGVLPLPAARRARVVALEIEDREQVFARLFETIMSGLEQASVMQREKRPFRPHLTIARLKQPTRIEPKSHASALPYAVESVCLYRSELRREGARYTVIEQAKLAPCARSTEQAKPGG